MTDGAFLIEYAFKRFEADSLKDGLLALTDVTPISRLSISDFVSRSDGYSSIGACKLDMR